MLGSVTIYEEEEKTAIKAGDIIRIDKAAGKIWFERNNTPLRALGASTDEGKLSYGTHVPDGHDWPLAKLVALGAHRDLRIYHTGEITGFQLMGEKLDSDPEVALKHGDVINIDRSNGTISFDLIGGRKLSNPAPSANGGFLFLGSSVTVPQAVLLVKLVGIGAHCGMHKLDEDGSRSRYRLMEEQAHPIPSARGVEAM